MIVYTTLLYSISNMSSSWKVYKTGESIPTQTYNKRLKTIKPNATTNDIWQITGPEYQGYFAAAEIMASWTSSDQKYAAIQIKLNLNYEDGLMDTRSDENLVLFFPYHTQTYGIVSKINFIDDTVTLTTYTTNWVNPNRQYRTQIINLKTGLSIPDFNE